MLKAVALTAALTVAVTAPALASNAIQPASVEVRIDDLNLTNTAGQQWLDRRIRAAARQLCASGARGLNAMQREESCIALALESAAPQAERAIALARSNRRLARIDMQIAG